MGVKPGFKQTEVVGVVPGDWEVRLLRDVVDFTNGRPHEGNVEPDGRYWLITLDSIGIDGRLKAEHKRTRTFDSSLEKDDIVSVLSDLAHGNLLGLCDLIPADGVFVLNQRMARLRLKVPASAQFVRLQINRRQEHFRKRGQGTSQKHVYRRDFDALPIPFPAPAEQEGIAQALSDAEALIESVEQLLAKKRQLKQGAMQELLTGKKRLPGFSGEWELKRLGEVAEIVMGQSPSSRHYNNRGEGLPLIQGNADITDRKTIKRVFTTAVTKRGRFGDILMSVRAPVGEVSRATFDVCLGRGVCAIRYPNNFLYHALIAKEPTWGRLSKGSTFDSVNSTDVKDFGIEIPKNDDEQSAIASIISDMDTEIAALEAKIAKARQLKQGMMQELLTGRIRLV